MISIFCYDWIYFFTSGIGTYNFLDTDNIIEKATSLTIPQIFEQEGEEGFRQVEAQILDSVHAYVRCVVSTGGGIVTRMQNWSKLQTGIVIWLDVDPETIIKRIEGTDRPLLQTENPLQTLKDLCATRKSKYEQADVRIEVTDDMNEDVVADAVVKAVHYFIDDNPPAWKKAKVRLFPGHHTVMAHPCCFPSSLSSLFVLPFFC